jgi:hypothetical protein
MLSHPLWHRYDRLVVPHIQNRSDVSPSEPSCPQEMRQRSGESGIACCQLPRGSGSGLHICALCSARGTYLAHHSATMPNGHISLSYGQLSRTKPKFEALLLTISRHCNVCLSLLLFDDFSGLISSPPCADKGWRTSVTPKCQLYPFQVSPLLSSIVTTADYLNTSFRALCDTLHHVTYLSLSSLAQTTPHFRLRTRPALQLTTISMT